MNCFQLVKTVLDELYEEISKVHGYNTNAVIKLKLTYLANKYKNLGDILSAEIDYSDPTTRFAYVYCYVTAHANVVFERIKDLEILQDAFNSQELTVGCLGGGPGSDILGILKFLNRYNENAHKLMKLNFVTLDKEPGRKEIWHNIDNKIATSLPFSPPNDFLRVDVTEGKTSISEQKIWHANVFTMIYFLSEIYAYREDTRSFFERLFSKAKPGMLFLFVDSKRQATHNWFDEVATSNGLEVVEEKNNLAFQMTPDEEKKDLGRYYDMFDHKPKLHADVVYRIYRKKPRIFMGSYRPVRRVFYLER